MIGHRLAGAALIGLLAATVALGAQSPQSLLNRAVEEFESSRFTASVATFDSLIRLAPDRAPYLWQRGIALYYAQRYADCRRQFESHRTVNPADVENAAWHFLCVARAESPARAKAALLPVGVDPRPPMREVYEMLGGRMTPDQVIAAAGAQTDAQFYAELYVGLYFEALGMAERARTHLTLAAADRFERVGGYMHMVARVHLHSLSPPRP